MENLNKMDINNILHALKQQVNKLKYQHNEYLKMDPEYDGPMVGQHFYDEYTITINKIENNLKINS